MPMTPREIVKLLEENGFEFISSNGSHRKYYNPETGKTAIVPFHAKELKKAPSRVFLNRRG